jgi:hypothetical protein
VREDRTDVCVAAMFLINYSFRAHNRSRNCRGEKERDCHCAAKKERDEKFCFFRPKPLCRRRTNFSAFHLECSQHYHFVHLTASTILSTMSRGFLGINLLKACIFEIHYAHDSFLGAIKFKVVFAFIWLFCTEFFISEVFQI